MQVLSIDSTTERLSVIISNNGEVVSKISRISEQNFMKKIIGEIDSAIRKAGTGINRIDAFGVNLGPGDFTGTRIGISVIKTMSFILDKPGYGIGAPDVFAVNMAFSNRDILRKNIGLHKKVLIITCMDVRKGELYYTIYDIVESKINDFHSAAAIDINSRQYVVKRIKSFLVSSGYFTGSLLEKLDGIYGGSGKAVILGGDATVQYRSMLSEFVNENDGYIIDKKSIFPVPESLDRCVNHCIKTGRAPGSMNPVYVREFIPFGKSHGSFHERKDHN
jgi:tRNA threonylcarbamoyl adenosine modification protein YeaZ